MISHTFALRLLHVHDGSHICRPASPIIIHSHTHTHPAHGPAARVWPSLFAKANGQTRINMISQTRIGFVATRHPRSCLHTQHTHTLAPHQLSQNSCTHTTHAHTRARARQARDPRAQVCPGLFTKTSQQDNISMISHKIALYFLDFRCITFQPGCSRTSISKTVRRHALPSTSKNNTHTSANTQGVRARACLKIL